jgi:hypothetical protein
MGVEEFVNLARALTGLGLPSFEKATGKKGGNKF